MASSTEFWEAGHLAWRVEHEGEHGTPHLHVEGTPPSTLEAIRETYLRKQAQEIDGPMKVDWVFEVPLVLAHGIVGFKHDEDEPDHDFEELRVSEAPRSAPRWKCW